MRVPSHEFLRTTFCPQKENFFEQKYFPKVKNLNQVYVLVFCFRLRMPYVSVENFFLLKAIMLANV